MSVVKEYKVRSYVLIRPALSAGDWRSTYSSGVHPGTFPAADDVGAGWGEGGGVKWPTGSVSGSGDEAERTESEETSRALAK